MLTCHVRHLHEHGRGEVDTLHQFKVDVHVEGHLSPPLHLLLLHTPLVAANETLTPQLASN